jgi:hypothetical protein
MYKDNATATRKPKCGRENFKGFCMEMADELEKILNVSFNICTHDVYGEQLENGTWNGMLGQLVRQVQRASHAARSYFLLLLLIDLHS